MKLISKFCIRKVIVCVAIMALSMGISLNSIAKSNDDFVVIIDPGHGGKDHGAIDNNAREKDINLAVALRLGELIEKKIKNSDVVFTRNDDNFVSLQGRADIANKAKGNLFISIHTNSVDSKNKNRASVAGASVYTLGPHKEGANMDIARRENAVIELENGYHQKYSGFDPNKDESYIIFEMAQKQNLAQSNRFAKMVQDNLVKMAGRKDRGVHQAGFWVLWSTSMPSVLVELDFICNPESAKFMTSKDGVNKLAEAIFEAVKIYEMNYRQSQRMAVRKEETKDKEHNKSLVATNRESKERKVKGKKTAQQPAEPSLETTDSTLKEDLEPGTTLGLAFNPDDEDRDLSHRQLQATRNQKKARHASDGRRRRSAKSRELSESRNVEGTIALRSEYTGKTETIAAADPKPRTDQIPDSKSKNKKKSKKKVSTKKVADKHTAASSSSKEDGDKLTKAEKKRLEKERKAQEAADRQVAAYKERLAKEQKKREKEQAKKSKNNKDKNSSSEVKEDKGHSPNTTSSGSINSSVNPKATKASSNKSAMEEFSDSKHAANRKSLKSKSTN